MKGFIGLHGDLFRVDIGGVEESEFWCCGWFQTLPASPAHEKLCCCKIHTYLFKLPGNYKCGNMCYSGGWLADEMVTFTFMHLADTFIQSDLQLHSGSGYTFSLVHVFPGNWTHNLLRNWCNALPLSHTGTLCTFFFKNVHRSHQ